MKKNSQTPKENVKKTACTDALSNLNQAVISLVSAECYTEAGYVLASMKDIVELNIVELMAEDYEDEDDDDDDDDNDDDDDY